MNRKRAKELLTIIEAFANGEEVEFREASENWTSSETVSFMAYDSTHYRIKPKAREFWLNPDSQSPDTAFYENFDPDDADFIKVREVLGGE